MTKATLAGVAIVLVTVFVACTRTQDAMLALSDRIEDEAAALRFAKKANSTVVHRFQAGDPWILILVPRSGFDEDQASKEGVQDELRREVVRRVPAWRGAALLVYATPRGTSITRLSERVDVVKQTVMRGDPGNVEISIVLTPAETAVMITTN